MPLLWLAYFPNLTPCRASSMGTDGAGNVGHSNHDRRLVKSGSCHSSRAAESLTGTCVLKELPSSSAYLRPFRQHPPPLLRDAMNDSERTPFRLARYAQQRAWRARGRRHPRPQVAGAAWQLEAGSPSQRDGARGENRALELLQRAGLQLLARNLRCRAGEIDLVMRDGEQLVFVEVRRRRTERYGGAAASIGAAKQRRLLRAAAWFLGPLAQAHWAGRTPPCRFDVVALESDGAHWLKDAFRAD